MHSWKIFCGKKCFHSKKLLGSHFLKKKRFLNLSCTTRHVLNQNFQTSQTWSHISQLDNFRIHNLGRVRFRTNKFYNGSDFEVNLVCKKTDFDGCFACTKSFLELFITQSPNFCSYLFSQKPWYGEKMDEKQFLNEKNWKESDFETSFYNASVFEPRISEYVRFLVNFN